MPQRLRVDAPATSTEILTGQIQTRRLTNRLRRRRGCGRDQVARLRTGTVTVAGVWPQAAQRFLVTMRPRSSLDGDCLLNGATGGHSLDQSSAEAVFARTCRALRGVHARIRLRQSRRHRPRLVRRAPHPQDPLALTDLIGLDTIKAAAGSLREGYEGRLRRPPVLARMVDAGLVGHRHG